MNDDDDEFVKHVVSEFSKAAHVEMPSQASLRAVAAAANKSTVRIVKVENDGL